MPSIASTSSTVPLGVGAEIADSATRLSVVLTPDPNARRWQVRLSSPPTPDAALAHLEALVLRAVQEHYSPTRPNAPLPPVNLGIALWGHVESRLGIVRSLSQAPGWSNFPLTARLAERLHTPVRVDSAVNAAAIAESALGAGMGYDPLLYVLIARTISAGLIALGQPLHGAYGLEGGLAHVPVRSDGPRCSCGARGHLEPIASAQAIVRTMIGRASDSDESLAAVQRITGGRAEALTAPQVVKLAAGGDPIARVILDDAFDALGLALANAMALLDPGAVIIAGPLAAAGEAFFSPLRTRLAMLMGAQADAPLMPAGVLEPRAALIGAFLLAVMPSAAPV